MHFIQKLKPDITDETSSKQRVYIGSSIGQERLDTQSIIHDVNNFLMVLILQCEQLKKDYDHQSGLSDKLQKIIDVADQTALLGRKINFSKTNNSKPIKIAITEIFRLIISQKELLNFLLQDKIELNVTPFKQQLTPFLLDGKILIDTEQILPILLQLVRNSLEAIESSKYRTVDTMLNEPKSIEIYLTISKQNNGKFKGYNYNDFNYSGYFLQIHVQDNGPGFGSLNGKNPLVSGVTSKKSEMGGHGLSSIQHILNKWDGFIFKESAKIGAHLSLNFPILKE